MFCNKCGKENSKNSKFCKNCGAKIKIVTSNLNSDEKKYQSIGGWLILVFIGLIISILRQGYGLIEYLSLLSNDYSIPGYYDLLLFEFFASIAFLGFSIYLLILFIRKNIKLPNYYIYLLIATIVFTIIDQLWLVSISSSAGQFQETINKALTDNSGEIVKSVIGAIIWGSYMKKSQRVKYTFINE